MVELTNNSRGERELDTNFFQVRDKEDRVYNFDSSVSLSHHHTHRTDAWHLEDIGPSFNAIMPVAFDVSEDVEILDFYPTRLKESDLSDTRVVRVELD